MKKGNRYDVSGLVEAQFERGSRGRVLKNRLGIRSRLKMDDAETTALRTAMDALVRKYDESHRFTAADICAMHRSWLIGIYEWAGEYRNVNLTKDGFPFAAAALVPSLMTRFERDVLARCTPCRSKSRDEVVRALAQAHVGLVLIHPFREGNGRRDYRPEPCRALTGMAFSSLVRVRTMVSTLAPVSMAVELETLVMRSLRNFSGSRRYGLVSMSGFFRMAQ
jgi:cell filamentation protein